VKQNVGSDPGVTAIAALLGLWWRRRQRRSTL
jgi:MYXO-CTERM domain-containing protein